MNPAAVAAEIEVDKPLWGIGFISMCIAWIEQLVVVCSAPLLTFVAILTVATAFQGGSLIDNSPFFTQAYSWSLGIGIEGQLAAMAYNARRAAVNHRGWQSFAYWCVVVVLYVIGATTGSIVAYQQAHHTTFDAALAAVGVPSFVWDNGRICVMFGLIVLSAATRYVKPAPKKSLQEQLAAIEEKRQIDAANALARSERLKGLVGAARDGIKAARGVEQPQNAADPVVESVAFAEQSIDETSTETSTNQQQIPDGFRVENQRGLWWDAPSYQAFILAAYNVGITLNKAQEVVQQVGKSTRGKRTGVSGASPYVARVTNLRNFAKSTYGDAANTGEVQTVSAVPSDVYAE